jgi:hypothetical protein
MPEPAEILAHLDAVRAETLKRLDSMTQDQLDWLPAPADDRYPEDEAWSVGEILARLAIGEHFVREHIARPLLEGVSPPPAVSATPPLAPYGAARDVIVFWLERARLVTRRMLQELPTHANLGLQHAGDLHPMNGMEWLGYLAERESDQLGQIDALLRDMRGTQAQGAASHD